MDDLKEEYKDNIKDEEMRKSILEKMETLRKEHFENMQKIL
jgi:hypothetical protein